VTGKRGTTTDVSFQLLGGEYTDEVVPDSETAFDDRETRHRGRRQLRMAVPPRVTVPAGDQGGLQRLVGAARLVRHQAARHRGHLAAAADPRTIEKRYATAGKQLVQRVKTWLQFPQWFYLERCRSTRWCRRG
jgi:hypothetical protein